jgi:hypothetical protein
MYFEKSNLLYIGLLTAIHTLFAWIVIGET